MELFCKYTDTYSTNQTNLIANEFKRLQDHYYLEHAGTTLYSERQINNIAALLCQDIFSNPHARNVSSKQTADCIDLLRYQILESFNTNSEEYSIIFTCGATGALKLLAENFSYRGGSFTYLQDNHTSVLGMRAYSQTCNCLKIEDAFKLSTKNDELFEKNEESNSLFVFPAQSNFSGAKYPLWWIDLVKKGAVNRVLMRDCGNWFVALDAASYCSTNKLDLSSIQPDFVVISFYKIFGYPTGLGALLVKNSSSHVLNKKYYGGGTVFMAQTIENDVIFRKNLHERFEDGTIPFLSILSLKEGYNTFKRLGLTFKIINEYTFNLARYLYRNLVCLHHSNGKPVIVPYHLSSFDNNEEQGAIVNFNVIRENGEYVGYAEVLNFANLYKIHLRTGCCCNPGACQYFLKLTPADVRKQFEVSYLFRNSHYQCYFRITTNEVKDCYSYSHGKWPHVLTFCFQIMLAYLSNLVTIFSKLYVGIKEAGHVCGDQHDLVDGYPTGSVRASFGYMSTKADADKLIEMIENCFVNQPVIKKLPELKCNELKNNTKICSTILQNATSSKGILEKIILYPIKSCGGLVVRKSWLIASTGLKYDRQWMIVNSSGQCITQKNNKNMCLIKPVINAELNTMTLTYPGFEEISISLEIRKNSFHSSFTCHSKVCEDKIQGWDCGDKVGLWLSNVLQRPNLRLLRQISENDACTRKSEGFRLSLANKAQYLMINQSSVGWLRDRFTNNFEESIEKTLERFRPNFVVNFESEFVENHFQEFCFGQITFQSSGPCMRCQMICIDQATGETSPEPLRTLSKSFKGKIVFGVYLNRIQNTEENIALGCEVIGLTNK